MLKQTGAIGRGKVCWAVYFAIAVGKHARPLCHHRARIRSFHTLGLALSEKQIPQNTEDTEKSAGKVASRWRSVLVPSRMILRRSRRGNWAELRMIRPHGSLLSIFRQTSQLTRSDPNRQTFRGR
jgi:hypothetical protein